MGVSIFIFNSFYDADRTNRVSAYKFSAVVLAFCPPFCHTRSSKVLYHYTNFCNHLFFTFALCSVPLSWELESSRADHIIRLGQVVALCVYSWSHFILYNQKVQEKKIVWGGLKNTRSRFYLLLP